MMNELCRVQMHKKSHVCTRISPTEPEGTGPPERTQNYHWEHSKGLTPGRLQGGNPLLTREKSKEQTKSKKSKKLIAESMFVYAQRESNSYFLHHKGSPSLREQDTAEVKSRLRALIHLLQHGRAGGKNKVCKVLQFKRPRAGPPVPLC